VLVCRKISGEQPPEEPKQAPVKQASSEVKVLKEVDMSTKALKARILELEAEREDLRRTLQHTLEYVNIVNQRFAEIYVHAQKIAADPAVDPQDLN
jgi:uncharacterized damage-inducible protein DinB